MNSLERLGKQHLPALAMIVLPFVLLLVPPAVAKSSSPTFPSYTWQVNCQSSLAGIPGSAVARWNWTVNGVSVSGSWAACGWNNPGNGTIPANANGIIASLSAQIKYCYHSTSTTQSFAPGTVPQIKLAESCQASAYGTPVSIKATFTLT